MIDQIGIALTGVIAIFLTQSKHEWLRRYACLFGIAGQPFWIYAAWTAGQWGILMLTMLYTFAWAKGVWTHWLRRPPPEVNPLAERAYVMSEPHFSGRGWRVVIGFDQLDAAQDAHDHIAKIGRAAERRGTVT